MAQLHTPRHRGGTRHRHVDTRRRRGQHTRHGRLRHSRHRRHPRRVLTTGRGRRQGRRMRLLLRHRAPMSGANTMLMIMRTINGARVHMLHSTNRHHLRINIRTTRHTKAISRRADRRRRHRPRPHQQRRTGNPTRPRITNLLPMFLTYTTAIRHQGRATHGSGAKSHRGRVSTPPQLHPNIGFLRHQRTINRRATLRIVRRRTRRDSTTRRFSIRSPLTTRTPTLNTTTSTNTTSDNLHTVVA